MSVVDVELAAGWLDITTAADIGPGGPLQRVLDAAEGKIARELALRTLGPTSYAERGLSAVSGLLLARRPVVSVVSLSAGPGALVDLTSLQVDRDAGRVSGPALVAGRAYDVVYVAGFAAPLPPDLELAVQEMTRHLWRPRRGAGNRSGGAQVEAAGFGVPHLVASLIEGYVPVDGFA